MTDRIAGSMPARSPRRLAALVASDVSAALNANASLDLQQYLPEQYGETLQTFVIIMRDGRTFSNHDDVPPALLEAVREEQQFMNDGPRRFGRRGGPGPPPDGDPREADGGRPPPPRRPPPRRGEFAPVLVDGMPVGRVIVLPGGPSFWRILTRLGPTMAPVAAGVLGVGMVVIAFVVFGPARRRLQGGAGGDRATREPAISMRARPTTAATRWRPLRDRSTSMADELTQPRPGARGVRLAHADSCSPMSRTS